MPKTLTDIRSLARSYAPKAIQVLGGIMSEPRAPYDARIRAASVLLDRGFGKPTQLIGGDPDAGAVLVRWLKQGEDEHAADIAQLREAKGDGVD